MAGIGWAALTLAGWTLLGAPPEDAAQDRFFRENVQPIFKEHCYACHSHSAERIRGGLLLDSASALEAGGDHGPVVIPGKPESSRLLIALQRSDPNLQMPPKGPALPDEQIAVLREWIRRGAQWPQDAAVASGGAMKARPRGQITDEDRRWWAFQPVQAITPPAADSHRAEQPLDRFIHEKLRRQGLTPAPPAEPRTFIRRISFDLIGLPPTPAEVTAFVADCASEQQRTPSAGPLPSRAVERLADRLLSSPHYGERAARLWLDLVRYAESDGYRVDDYRPHSWRYRDWVTQAFNADLPYDRFVQAQLAGDELWPEDPQTARVATSLLRHGIYEYNNRDARGQWQTILNEITDLTGDVFLGLGFQCARCHDHKFDPLLQKDYYRLQAFFGALEFRNDLTVATAAEEQAHAKRLAEWQEATAELRTELAALEAPYREQAKADAISKFPPDIQPLLQDLSVKRPPGEELIARLAYRQVSYEFDRLASKFKPADKLAIEAVQRRLREYDALKPDPLPAAYTVTDLGPEAAPTRLPKSPDGPPVEPGFPTVLDPEPATLLPIPQPALTTGRRATLARWITSPTNPLTARVIVNRLWQQHFGRGLVGTSSDFGTLGDRPTHPELLDWLATELVTEGWSLKHLHRTIVTSATYAQAATNAPSSTTDPENRWLARFPTRRLEAEQIRDALLAVSGELQLGTGGPSEPTSQPRRTLYTRVTRNTRDPLLDVFDAPENFTSTSQRNVTTTPTQSLLLINGPTLLQRAQAFAKRVVRESGSNDPQRVETAYQLALGRPPRATELAAATRFLEEQPARIPPHPPKDASFLGEKMPYREGRAAVLAPKSAQARFLIPARPAMPDGDFTLESYVLLRTPPERDGFRTLAARWDGAPGRSGWALSVAGGGVTEKAQTLVLRMGSPGTTNAPWISSGVPLELNKPYFIAVTVKPGDDSDGAVVFGIRDISNDCEPMQIIRARCPAGASPTGSGNLAIGALANAAGSAPWDGLMDDLRFSRTALPPEQWLIHDESLPASCFAWWRFEPTPGSYQDHSPNHNDLPIPNPRELEALDPRTQALADLGHVLLNSSEFLYTD